MSERAAFREIIGRLDYAYEIRDEGYFLGSYEPMLITRKPSDYLKMMYMDTTSYHSPAIRCAADTIGADRLLFGSDCPMLLSLKAKALAVIDELNLPAEQKVNVLGGTAKRLLKL